MDVLLFFISMCSGFLPLPFFLILKKELNDQTKLILPFLVLTFFSSFYELVFTTFLLVDAAVWFKVYSFLAFFVLMHYFYKLLKGRYPFLYCFFGIVYLASFGLIVSEGKIDNFLDGDSYLQVVESVFAIMAIVLWMKNIFISQGTKSLLKSPQFYFISGLLFYFSGTFFLFLLGDVILKEGNDEFLANWIFNYIFNLILNIFLLVGIWKGKVK